MRSAILLLSAAGVLAGCGSSAAPGRAQVQGLDRVSGEVTAIEVELGGADLASVRGPAGWVVVGAAIVRRLLEGAGPEGAGQFVASLRAGIDAAT